MGLFGKKKTPYKITEPTPEMIANQDIDEEEIKDEVEEGSEIKMIRANPKASVKSGSKEFTMEDIEKQQEELNQRIKEINEREKQVRPKERIEVVKELPMLPARQYKDEEGSVIHLMTIEEYLTAQANKE